jgi:hypothetical protein
MSYDATKDILRCWFIILMAVFAVFLVLGLCKLKEKGDMQVSLSITNVGRANTDIRGYYDMYSKSKTEKGRDRVIEKMNQSFNAFDATLIEGEKYRNFLINTRKIQ